MKWKLVYKKQAQNDARKATAAGLKEKVQSLFEVLEGNPYQNPPPYEKLVGDLAGAFGRLRRCLRYQVSYLLALLGASRS